MVARLQSLASTNVSRSIKSVSLLEHFGAVYPLILNDNRNNAPTGPAIATRSINTGRREADLLADSRDQAVVVKHDCEVTCENPLSSYNELACVKHLSW